MSCIICKRGACCKSFHSLEEQERHDLLQEMSQSDNVQKYLEELLDSRAEIVELKKDNEELKYKLFQSLLLT